jgi:hypothetical protein
VVSTALVILEFHDVMCEHNAKCKNWAFTVAGLPNVQHRHSMLKLVKPQKRLSKVKRNYSTAKSLSIVHCDQKLKSNHWQVKTTTTGVITEGKTQKLNRILLPS